MGLQLQCRSLYPGGADLLSSSLLLEGAYPVCIDIVDRLHFAEPDALRVSVTEVAFEILPVNDVKAHCAEGADRDAGTTANAFVVIYHDPAELLIPRDGLHGADDLAGGILALLAGHGNVDSLLLPFHDLDPAS